MKNIFSICFLVIIQGAVFAQSGSLQIYCDSDVLIYIDNKFKGKSTEEMSGLLVENLKIGEISVRAVKEGFVTKTVTASITSGKVTEIDIYLQQTTSDNSNKTESPDMSLSLDGHFGTFGLFNVNNVFTKADYSFGFTPAFDYRIQKYFSLGVEFMTMWGKPKTDDDPRLMLCPNLRAKFLFQPFEKIYFSLLIASGFSTWPAVNKISFLTQTFNESRMGWDFRASAGIRWMLAPKTGLNISFGYWASSTSSDNIVWITHDTMLLSAGPVFLF